MSIPEATSSSPLPRFTPLSCDEAAGSCTVGTEAVDTCADLDEAEVPVTAAVPDPDPVAAPDPAPDAAPDPDGDPDTDPEADAEADAAEVADCTPTGNDGGGGAF